MKSRCARRDLLLTLAICFVSLAGGCLSIGGKVVHENPETASRLERLESRVSSLEKSIGTSAN